MEDWLGLRERVIIVTGGSSGFGRAICRELDALGAQVVNADISAPEQVIGTYIHCDVTKQEDIDSLVGAVCARYGRIDGLVNNAGINRPGLLIDEAHPQCRRELTRTDFDRTMDIDLKGVLFLSQAAARKMAAQGKGVIVNISSTCGARGSKGQSIYAAAKAAVNSVTRSLALELGKYGIRVVAVTPGIHEPTALSSPAYLDALAYTRGTTAERIDSNYADSIPLGRVGKLTEVADAVCYLLSDRASYITGTILNVSGGKTTD